MDLLKLREKFKYLPSSYNRKVSDKFSIPAQRVSQLKNIVNTKDTHRFNKQETIDVLVYMAELADANREELEAKGLA